MARRDTAPCLYPYIRFLRSGWAVSCYYAPNLHLWRGPNSNPAGSRSRKTSVKLFCQRGKTTSMRSTCMPTLATLAAQLRTLSTIFHATLPTPVISHPLRTCRCHPELTLNSGLFCNTKIAIAETDRYITSDVVYWTPADCGVAHMSIAVWEDTVEVLIVQHGVQGQGIHLAQSR